MASHETPAAAAATTSHGNDTSVRTVTIHILSPSLPAPSRFTLRDLPLETTVGQLRSRITHSLPGHPAPSTQRLIYRGRPLANNNDTMADIFRSVEGTEHSIHMVLPPPSAPAPANNRASLFGSMSHTERSSQLPGSLAAGSTALSQSAGDGLRFRGLPTPATTHERHLEHISNILNRATSATSPYSPLNMNMPNPTDLGEYEDLRRQVESAEHSLDHSFVPSHETLYQLRSRVEQLVQREGRFTPASAQALLQRIMALYRRVDSLPSNRDARPAMPAGSLQSPLQVFLATGPDGRQSLIMPINTANVFPLSTPLPQPGNTHTVPIDTHNVHHAAPAGQNPAGMQDIVRQAVINQQRRREVENIPAGQYLRRIWLFIRLYFCIYMISSSGTWARVFLVAGAVLIALLSDTEIPRRLQGMLVEPIQRHLEGLAHIGGPADRATQAAGDQNSVAGGHADNTIRGELWSSIRRMERAIVLLLASLIPGIGERQVEARNAAEAEAERLRQEEQQRLQEQQQQEEAQAESQPDTVAEGAVETDTTVDSGATEQPQPEQAVPA
ncbi:uncharacterized protein N7496_011689 [Penicillium cataractarum]|uniref:Ubiquitin-like domain-containing protein n=1 Tax=Penicillium cataractarum TaxID=2100454 RepID=A0A9W9UYA2_9EURO|nr:uncharacterized protein N7496_011689 [Penicillium cataractarum]KAJ5359276.1 hypothetical protein N7496_011689 [Penicillium cataractarum]